MDELFVQVRTAGYWLSVALMSIALNLSAAYLKPPLDRLIARVFARVRERTNQRREARTRLVAQLRTDPTEYLMLAITRTHYLIRATLSLAFAGVFLFALFVNPGTGISTSILGVAATYSLILCGRQLTYSINVGELLADVRRSPQEPYATT